ncbi:MAG TPA: spore coat protein CotJB [Candidatus Hungatella pullicola]|nr:spore coat protein CotJB [Candidatus Hungatella pullicola]
MADRIQLMKEIYEVSFGVNDLTLYLDTHPRDQEALQLFDEYSKRRKQLLKLYGESFEPLTADCICPESNNQSGQHTKYAGEKHWTWTDGPLPWEGGV